jgi:branched-chain amino acid transport system permease protein
MIDLSRYLQFLFSGITMGSIYAIMAVSLTIVYRVSKVINFVQGEFFMIGALTMTSLLALNKFPFLLTIVLAILLVSLVGVLTERLVIKPLKEASIGVIVTMTVGVSLFIKGLAMIIWGKEPFIAPPFLSLAPVAIKGASITPQVLIILMVTLVVVMLLWWFFERTELGLGIRACAENKTGASLIGINPGLMASVAWILGAGLGGLAGVLVTPLLFVDYLVGTVPMLKGFIAIAMGGLSSIGGAILGGILVGLIEAFSVGLISSKFSDVIIFTILILILIFKPSGLFSKEVSETGGM